MLLWYYTYWKIVSCRGDEVMEKKYIPRIILLDTIIYTLIIVTLYLILSFCKLMFREWIYIVSTIIIMFGFIVRIIQLLLKIKKKM